MSREAKELWYIYMSEYYQNYNERPIQIAMTYSGSTMVRYAANNLYIFIFLADTTNNRI